MAFKESIAYSKNLITGNKIEKTKKKIVAPVQGIATVKIYDSLNGKQIYEAKSENRISAIFANSAYMDTYFYPMLENKQEYLLKDIYYTYPFRTMFLTTGDIPEDPYDYWSWGHVEGYADAWYPYSGSSELMGTINAAETTYTIENGKGIKHFVFDFPTHCANSTFQSIYWSSGSNDYTSAQVPNVNRLYYRKALIQGNLSIYNLCTDETALYCLKSGYTDMMIFDKSTAERKSNLNLSFSGYAMDYDGTNFWVLLSDGSFKKLDKSFNIVTSYSKSSAIPGTLVYGVNYYDIAVTSNYIYIAYNGCINTSGDSTYYRSCIAQYNKDGTFVRSVEIYMGTTARVNITSITNNKLYAIINDKRCFQLNEDLGIYQDTGLSSYYLMSFTWDNDRQTIFGYRDSSTDSINEYNVVPASAHTLLPETITKTPTNTMKIQYDFICDYVNPLDMPAH
ncbi:hypothetical protein [Clostridium grantii]|uniref:Uncharacterized protein n=1 Tax=Clostridium grantii DSM 8605 TaxID=1121316 RepID=A0A1M5U939_9CLOT|nr:hypothetical protein [Clostridium grantii]SHH59487.1 hypothetical protein SAMN02745207_01650 [Clostridium grantii DSM 8605]